MKKYLIKMTNTQFNTVKYKRYKCIDGWSTDSSVCWKFSKQGATNIIKRLECEYKANIHTHFALEEA